MTLLPLATLLRHRPPALLLGAIEGVDGHEIRCASAGAGPWRWGQMLEGAAQAAGLLAGLQAGGITDTAVIAEYRDVVVHTEAYAGPLRFVAHLDRRILHFWRCRLEARALDGTVLLAGTVTIAPGSGPTDT